MKKRMIKENENEQANLIRATTFYTKQDLQTLWAHLEEECNEALAAAVPLIRSDAMYEDGEKKLAAMELADVQVMCSTIIAKLEWESVPNEMELDVYKQAQSSLALQIINFVERRAMAAMVYRNIIRGYCSDGLDLYDELRYLQDAAEGVMRWIYPEFNERHSIRAEVFEKNRKRGYYL